MAAGAGKEIQSAFLVTHINDTVPLLLEMIAKPNAVCAALTAVSVSVPVSAMAVKAGGGGDLHFQLLALGGVCWHGVAVVGPQTALALSPHRLRELIGCVQAGAPAAPARELRGEHACQSNSQESPWQQMGRGHSELKIRQPEFFT